MASRELLLLRYQVDEVKFIFNEKFDFSGSDSIELNQSFLREIKKIDNDRCRVTIGLQIDEMETQSTPFTLKVLVSGFFELNDWENNKHHLMQTNAIAILYPFLRALVATLTANVNIPPYILPVFNVLSWFEENEKKKVKKCIEE